MLRSSYLWAFPGVKKCPKSLTLGNDIIRVGSTFCLDAWHHAGGAGIFMLMQKNSSWRVKCHPIITGIFTRSIR
jgi:hypothetical protein